MHIVRGGHILLHEPEPVQEGPRESQGDVDITM